jgi:uncharacterized protein with gpF-like domain
VNDPQAQAWLGDRLEEFSEQVTGTTFDEIDAILQTGFAEGQPLTTIAGTLRERFASWDKYRAPLIARTEAVSALNNGSLLAVKQAGIAQDVKKAWLTAGDEVVRATHQTAGLVYSKGIPVDEMFTVGGDLMLTPGDGRVAAENINCRCTIMYVKAKK